MKNTKERMEFVHLIKACFQELKIDLRMIRVVHMQSRKTSISGQSTQLIMQNCYPKRRKQKYGISKTHIYSEKVHYDPDESLGLFYL
jgi:hypothetical protein